MHLARGDGFASQQIPGCLYETPVSLAAVRHRKSGYESHRDTYESHRDTQRPAPGPAH